MKFKINRTSLFSDQQPIEEAKKDFIEDGWYININNLEELLQLQNKYGNIILCKYECSYELEVYDTWRE